MFAPLYNSILTPMARLRECSFVEPSLEVCLMYAADVTEAVSEQTLQLLTCSDSFVSIPCINVAAKIALGIFSMTQVWFVLIILIRIWPLYDNNQKAKSNRKKFIALGEEACKMVTEIIRKVNAAEQPDSNANMTSLQEDCRNMLLYAFVLHE